MIKYVLSALLLQGCGVGNINFSVDRRLLIEYNGTKVEISGDIIGVEDYPQVHKLLKEIRNGNTDK